MAGGIESVDEDVPGPPIVAEIMVQDPKTKSIPKTSNVVPFWVVYHNP